MEDQLKDLPEILNQGRMKNVVFKDQLRQNVLQKTRELHRPPAPKSVWYHWFHQSLSLALGVLFIVVFIQFVNQTDVKVKEQNTQLSKIPYVNQAILTKVKHDMRNFHHAFVGEAKQEGDTVTAYIIFEDHTSKPEQKRITEEYLKEISHLTLNEPYGAQIYLGELWKYVNVKVYTSASDHLLLASRLDIDLGYEMVASKSKDEAKLSFLPVEKNGLDIQKIQSR